MSPKRTGAPTPQPRGRIPGEALASWRERRLLRAGLDADLAADVAADCGFDLHALIELLERGCPPALALRILAPLDHEVSPC